jgi:elongation factor Ts
MSFAKDLALHIVSNRPKWVSRQDVPADVLAEEKAAQMRMEDIASKPDNIKEKIVDGRLEKWYQEHVLMEQAFFKDEDKTIQQLLESVVAEVGEKVAVRRFARYESPANSALGTYIHGGGKIGVIVELVAQSGSRTATMDEVSKDVAMHIAAAEPRFLRREDVTEKDLETEREIARDAALKSGKPENIVEKMVSGKMEKFYGEACLLEQPYIKDDKSTVGQYVAGRGKAAGCEYVVTRYTRYKLGEGIEKKSEDFAAEVASYIKQ